MGLRSSTGEIKIRISKSQVENGTNYTKLSYLIFTNWLLGVLLIVCQFIELHQLHIFSKDAQAATIPRRFFESLKSETDLEILFRSESL